MISMFIYQVLTEYCYMHFNNFFEEYLRGDMK